MKMRRVLRNGEFFAEWAESLEELAEFAEVDVNEFEFESTTVTSQAVDVERDRRIDSGFVFNGRTYQSRAQDRENMTGAAQLAFMAITAGAAEGDLQWQGNGQDFLWIDAENELVPMDAFMVVELGKAAAAWKTHHIHVARAIKDMEPIPQDFTDDKYWT